MAKKTKEQNYRSGIDLQKERDNVIRTLIFAYVLTILFDGIFRKWILPDYSTPIMMVKQFIALAICGYGLPYFAKMSIWEKSFFAVGVMVFITTFLFGHQNIFVALYGCLPYWFGLPVCFIMGQVLNYTDLRKIARLVVRTSIINSLLLILQFNLPVTHWLNYQGGEMDVNIIGFTVSSLEGGFRPSGLFVYNSQNAMFQMLALSFMLFYLFLKSNNKHNRVIIPALILNILSLPFSVSRTNIFYQIGVVAFFIVFCLQKSRRVRVLKVSAIAIIILAILSSLPMVGSALRSINARFDNASEVQYGRVSTTEGTIRDIWNRNVVYNFEALIDPHTIEGDEVPFWGYGQGMSTQVGGRLLGLHKNSGFSLAEWDGLRIMCESGLLFGWLIVFLRVGYAFRFLFRLRLMNQQHKYLSLMLMPSFLVSFYLLNNWGNLFQSNFAFLVGGLFLAAYKYRIYDGNNLPHKNSDIDVK